MKSILVLLVLLSQLSFAYEYSQNKKHNFIQGCLKTGASQNFCSCQINAMESIIPSSELRNFNKSLVSIYRGGSTNDLPNLHFKAMQEMSKCVGL